MSQPHTSPRPSEHLYRCERCGRSFIAWTSNLSCPRCSTSALVQGEKVITKNIRDNDLIKAGPR